jgi:hypothetical protein
VKTNITYVAWSYMTWRKNKYLWQASFFEHSKKVKTYTQEANQSARHLLKGILVFSSILIAYSLYREKKKRSNHRCVCVIFYVDYNSSVFEKNRRHNRAYSICIILEFFFSVYVLNVMQQYLFIFDKKLSRLW